MGKDRKSAKKRQAKKKAVRKPKRTPIEKARSTLNKLRRLEAREPGAHRVAVLEAHLAYSNTLVAQGFESEGITELETLLPDYRALAAEQPEPHRPELVTILATLREYHALHSGFSRAEPYREEADSLLYPMLEEDGVRFFPLFRYVQRKVAIDWLMDERESEWTAVKQKNEQFFAGLVAQVPEIAADRVMLLFDEAEAWVCAHYHEGARDVLQETLVLLANEPNLETDQRNLLTGTAYRKLAEVLDSLEDAAAFEAASKAVALLQEVGDDVPGCLEEREEALAVRNGVVREQAAAPKAAAFREKLNRYLDETEGRPMAGDFSLINQLGTYAAMLQEAGEIPDMDETYQRGSLKVTQFMSHFKGLDGKPMDIAQLLPGGKKA